MFSTLPGEDAFSRINQLPLLGFCTGRPVLVIVTSSFDIGKFIKK